MEEMMELLKTEIRKLEAELALKTREIEVEKALEKIRNKALAMHQSAELSETSALLFQQLKELKIEAIRTGVGIFDDENNAIELWITSVTEDGHLVFLLDYVNVHVHPVFENIIESRKAALPFALTRLEGKELLDYYTKMSTYIGIPDRRNVLPCEYFYSFFFSAGTINVVSNEELNDEETSIMLRLANVFGLIYTRFLDLKKLEDQAVQILEEKTTLEATLNNLRSTQAQLIQAEKMASLGELTAGIAHEIQNPLNFVNNFAEVNKELVAELKQEVENGNLAEVKALAEDIEENEQKIYYHGRRADAIVKSMLEHSHNVRGEKRSTDVNQLTDEYLRMSYHGFRVKEKQFDATIETSFDEEAGSINVVPQDLGRVLLNLFNNAFYALNEKKKTLGEGYEPYEPWVSVKTKKNDNQIEIIIKDNGIGMTEKVVEKVFQPFFTTKPTGEGSGLGLSLSYDIVTKVYGGELKVESVENEGSVFTLVLPQMDLAVDESF